jgi:hypothetical protein
MDSNPTVLRRHLLIAAGTAFTMSLFSGTVKGANSRIAFGSLGVGTMGSGRLSLRAKTRLGWGERNWKLEV